MAKTISVFASYSWKLEDESHFLDGLGEQCHLRNIKLIRDAKTLQPGERISKFMERIAGASHVITVFSQRYFESEYCLYELMNVLQYKGLEQKIYPVMADDLKLDDAAAITKLVQHWKQKRDELEALVIENGAGTNPALDERLNLYQEFVIKIGKLMKQAGDILAVQTTTCNEQKYSSVLDLICPLYQISPTAIFQPAHSDQDFMLEIKARLQDELNKSNALRKAIATQVGAKGSDENSDKLACILINCCENTLDELLRDDVHLAVDEALQAFASRPDNASPLVVQEVQQLTSSADGLFSCLVLYAVREQWMADYRKGCSSAASNLRQMPFGAVAAVEIVTSRHLQRVPRFKLNTHKSEIMGEEGVAALEQGFEKDDIVTGILRQIWVKVFPMDSPENLNEKRLGAQIRTRHKRKGVKKNNYYLVVPDDANHPLSDTIVRDELMRRLPELPLIILKTANCADALLISDDEELVSIIFDFYLMLDEYIPYEPDKDH